MDFKDDIDTAVSFRRNMKVISIENLRRRITEWRTQLEEVSNDYPDHQYIHGEIDACNVILRALKDGE